MGFELAYEDWESGIEKYLLNGMSTDEREFAYGIREKLYNIKNSQKPIDFDFYDCLNSMHYFFFNKPIITAPKIKLNCEYSAMLPAQEIKDSTVYLESLEPNTVFEEFFHFSLYHEYFYFKPMSMEERMIFVSETSCHIQHIIMNSVIQMIIPEYHEAFIKVKKNSELLKLLSYYQNPDLIECRELASNLILR